MDSSRLAGFIIDCNTPDLGAAADFWSQALRMEQRRLPGEEGGKYIQLLEPTDALHVEVQTVSHPSRVHLDIEAADVDAEVRRLEALGAKRVAQVHTWWVMEAPTGQRFCVVRLQNRRPALKRWHALVANKDASALDDLLADDCVFESPALHTPQAGKALTRKYLEAALHVLNGPGFRYVGEWYGERTAVLEFQCDLDGVQVDGVDMIWWNADDRIVRFKVMLRPFKALQAVMARMAAELQR